MSSRQFLLAAALCFPAAAQTIAPDVGSGAPSETIRQQFQLAFYRNGFAYLVTLPPIADVRRFGTNGLVQEYADAKNAAVRFALVMPSQSTPVVEGRIGVFQVHGGMYSYFTSVGVSTAGMPSIDTANCPSLVQANSCQYQLFDRNYALFVYKNPVDLGGTTFATRDPYYTKWTGYGGIGVLGPASSTETAVTSSTTAAGTVQEFDRGAIYNFTAGNLAGKRIGIKQPIWDIYKQNAKHAGSLGFPTSEELVATNGRRRQSFENGSVEYDPVTGVPVFLPAVSSITITTTGPVRLNLGETVTLNALVVDSLGNRLTDRDILWQTSDSRIASLQQAGATVVVRAAGRGTATIRATSEAKTSIALTVIVSSPCCAVGEGAPTQAIARAFQDALTRNQLNVKQPVAAPVVRTGSGYLQVFETADGQSFTVAVADRVLTGFVLSGRILAAYLARGGPLGPLGYPMNDATPGGRQLFEGGALAGDPVQLVTGDVLSKWALLGYETGAAGAPTGLPAAFLTFRATRGVSQSFRGATLFAVAPGRVFAVTGVILGRYLASGGAAGRIGAPVSDEYGLNGRRKQDFEGGSIEYAAGSSSAELTEEPRQPVVTASPSVVLAGGRVSLAVGGFEDGATVRVTITGQPDFVVTVASGAYAWEAFIPASARAGTVTLRAVNTGNASNAAVGSYTVRSAAEARLQVAVLRGDNQTGAPGALLGAPLRVVVKDEGGTPAPNVAVQFSASPGARIESAPAMTDENGEAAAVLRLPLNEGLALATARAGGQVVTFSARASAMSLANFPRLTQAVAGTLGDSQETIARKGAMLASTAAILRYYQGRGELPGSPADVAGLNDYLRTVCTPGAAVVAVCDGYLTAGPSADPIVNLWRLTGIAGPLQVSVEKPAIETVRDLVASGSPVLLALALSVGEAQLGSHFVVATGVGADGDVVIMDPNPAFNRPALSRYFAGFQTDAGTVRGSLSGAVRLLPGPPRAAGFLVAVNAAVEIHSPVGPCGSSFEFPGAVAVPAPGFVPPPEPVRLRACDGTLAELFQLDLTGRGAYRGTFRDLGAAANVADLSGAGFVSLKVARRNGLWGVGPNEVTVLANGVVNAASFKADLAPGAIATIFGAGLARVTKATVNGEDARLLGTFPFQVNVQIPPAAMEGTGVLRLEGEAGSAESAVRIVAVAPAVFLVGQHQGAVVNRNGTLNGPGNPAARGDVLVAFGTGFGRVSPKGNLMEADVPVRAFIGETEVPVEFAGLTPGFVGLYQVNVTIPVQTPPGLSLAFTVEQGNSTSNTVEVAIQ